MSEFKLNVSVRIGDMQLTARADEESELESNMAYLMETFGKSSPTTSTPQKPSTDNPSNPAWCSTHNVEMKEKEGKYGKFFSHYVGVYPEGSWCKGK